MNKPRGRDKEPWKKIPNKADQRLLKAVDEVRTSLDDLYSDEGLEKVAQAMEDSGGNPLDAAKSLLGNLAAEVNPDQIADDLIIVEELQEMKSESEEAREAAAHLQLEQMQSAEKKASDIHKGRRPIVNEEPRTGRNNPCPCGSGKKYKQCCLRKESEEK